MAAANGHLTPLEPQWLHGIVDMGSNGIRCSITALTPKQARLLPALYTDRAAISLYDAQYPAGSTERQPIPSQVIAAVLQHFYRFKDTLTAFEVPAHQVTVLATEATRTAINADDFINKIETDLSWKVKLLSKTEEGQVGALGVMSSVDRVHGLIMDLGGGSTQLSWVSEPSNDESIPIESRISSVSLPYGAAALNRRLNEASTKGPAATQAFTTEVGNALANAVTQLRSSRSARDGFDQPAGFDVYLSGGGFRGWGYVLMNAHAAQPYPIPTINGFEVDKASFLDTAKVQSLITNAFGDNPSAVAPSGRDTVPVPGLFRVSPRRASQVPAVSFLITTLATVLPNMSRIRFYQGGVREGYLYKTLPAAVQRGIPLALATAPYYFASAHPASSPAALTALLAAAIPRHTSLVPVQDLPDEPLLLAFTAALYTHSRYPKDVAPGAALRFSTAGDLAAAHGISHVQRAALGVFLCETWGGCADLSDSDRRFYDALAGLVPVGLRWWVLYLARVGALVRAVCPAGLREGADQAVEAGGDTTRKGRSVWRIRVRLERLVQGGGGLGKVKAEWFEDEARALEKIGKKKSWIGGEHGYGFKVKLEME